jgi:hypothetical protein
MRPTYAAGLNGQDELSLACIEDLSDPKKLVLGAILLDTVKEVTSTSPALLGWSLDDVNMDTARKMFQKTLPSNATTTYFHGQTLFDAYWRTLMFDATTLERIQEEDVVGFRSAFQAMVDESLELPQAQNSQALWSGRSKMQQIVASFDEGTFPTSFGYTQNALMAMFPQSTQAGDIVVILYGGRTSFVVRPIPGNDTDCRLVGPAYVHGFMDGEAFKLRDEGLLEAGEVILI